MGQSIGAKLRDTPLYSVLRAVASKKTALYPEEESDFLVPTKKAFQGWQQGLTAPWTTDSPSKGFGDTDSAEKIPSHPDDEVRAPDDTDLSDDAKEKYILVDWYDADDTANPRNWSKWKKLWVVGVIW